MNHFIITELIAPPEQNKNFQHTWNGIMQDCKSLELCDFMIFKTITT